MTSYENLVVTYSSTNYKHIKDNANLINLNQGDIKLINETFESSLILIDPKLIKVSVNNYNKFYRTLDEAVANKHSYYPGIQKLSEEFILTQNFRPIKVRKIEDENYSYELTGGMMRYWSWIKTYKNKNLIQAIITN